MDNWTQLKTECSACSACGLCQGRRNMVFGAGSEQAKILLVGEGPGEQEDLQGVPFVGPAGKLLDDMLEIIDLDRTKVYIANIVKCRPPMNRDPKPEESAACRQWLERQIALLAPQVIVCLGRIAACALIHDEFRITREHGIWYESHGVPCLATYHPSALLRDPAKRPEAFTDLIAIRSKIQEITGK